MLIEQTGTGLADTGVWKSVAGRLADLKVEAELEPSPPRRLVAGKPRAAKRAPAEVATKRVVVEDRGQGLVTDALAATLQRPRASASS